MCVRDINTQANTLPLIFLFVNLPGSKAQPERLGGERETKVSLSYRARGVEVQVPWASLPDALVRVVSDSQ